MVLEVIKHSEISENNIKRVIAIKNSAWPYSFKSQIEWIDNNLSSKDLHVILKDNNDDIAYLNMCPVEMEIDGINLSFYGIGNVCTKIHGKGHGGILIQLVNMYLKKNNLHGLLFCKEKVVGFYTRYNWEIIPSYKIDMFEENHHDVITMVYNCRPFDKAKYIDRSF